VSDDPESIEPADEALRRSLARHLFASSPLMRRVAYASHMYGFPEAVLEPGAEQNVSVSLSGPFHPSKIIMTGFMKEIRGSFRIKRTRLPDLDRDDVISSHTRVYRGRRGKKIWFRKGRTTIEFRGNEKVLHGFTRTYLPSSIVYEHTDPLSYIALMQLKCDNEATLRDTGHGVVAQFFGTNQLGNALPMSTANASIVMLLKNHGDVQVKVRATIMGMEYR
jgi:hypothetical protein